MNWLLVTKTLDLFTWEENYWAAKKCIHGLIVQVLLGTYFKCQVWGEVITTFTLEDLSKYKKNTKIYSVHKIIRISFSDVPIPIPNGLKQFIIWSLIGLPCY